jgi:hypothetical protein
MTLRQMRIAAIAIVIAAFATGLRVLRHDSSHSLFFALFAIKTLLVLAASLFLYGRVGSTNGESSIQRARYACLAILLVNSLSILADASVLTL